MMHKWLNLLLIPCVFLLSVSAKSESGMYPVSEIQQLNLKALGLQLTADEIFSPNKTSLADGICNISGCSCTFVSDQGLVITNHHCAVAALQALSMPGHDLLETGFLASEPAKELKADAYTVRVTKQYRDVSGEVLAAVNPSMSSAEREKAIEQAKRQIENAAEKSQPMWRAEVAEMVPGLRYVLFSYDYLKDVRLVFAPPQAVGQFGGDIDNWEWPRHNGDFAFFRVYSDNKPYKPSRVIPINPKGVTEGDAVFIMGYPGRTFRNRPASFLKYQADAVLPEIIDSLGWQIELLERQSEKSEANKQKFAERIATLGNGYKLSKGKVTGIKKTELLNSWQAEDAALQKYILDNHLDQQASLLKTLEDIYAQKSKDYGYEFERSQLLGSNSILGIVFSIYDAAMERQKPDMDREGPYRDKNWDRTREALKINMRNYDAQTDTLFLHTQLERLAKYGQGRSLAGLSSMLKDQKSMDKFAQSAVASRLSDPKRFDVTLSLLPKDLEKVNDPALKVVIAAYAQLVSAREKAKADDAMLSKLLGDFVDVKQKFKGGQFLPDANGTLRFTSGHVKGYSPADGIFKTPITTLAGVMEKTTGQAPFNTPKEVIKAYQSGDFSHEPVAILYDTDTTGGNSGSAVLDKNGHLVAVNFDRCYEATINDYAWNENYSRSIGVDIRYPIWLMNHVYGASNLLKEIGVH